MKKIRYIPYGYTVCEGRTVIESAEADIIRFIFDEYIKGSSLKELAEELTRRRVPYTEKTDAWDKARIARIIDNVKYTGSGEYDPIIEERIYEEAVNVKSSRQRSLAEKGSVAIGLIRDKVRCAKCGSIMVRQINAKRKIKENWICSNPECGMRVGLSDEVLLQKIKIIINRIIDNADLVLPKVQPKLGDSAIVNCLQKEIDTELEREFPSEEFIVSKIGDMASQLYAESQGLREIAARRARQRVLLMQPTDNFNCEYFSELVDVILLDETGKIILVTKTENRIAEGEEKHGCGENS